MKKSKSCIILGEQNEDVLELSNSKVKTWRTCPFCYYLKYIQKLRPIKKKKSLTTGTWVHECLEAKNRGLDVKARFEELVKKEWEPMFLEEKQGLGDIPGDVKKLLNKYFKAYKANDAQYTPVLIEQDFMIRVPKSPIVLTGKIDRIVTDELGRYWIWEYKTAKKIPENEMQQVIDPQTGIYSWVIDTLIKKGIIPEREVAGVVYDYIRSKPPGKPFELKSGGLSKAKNKLGCDYESYLKKIKELGLNQKDYATELSMLKAKEGEFLRRIAVTKSPVMVQKLMKDLIFSGIEIFQRDHADRPFYPRHINYTCTSASANKCDYMDACILDLQGHDYSPLIGVLYERSKKSGENDEEN